MDLNVIVSSSGAPASMVKSNAGQTRHSLPASSMTSATKLSQSMANGGLEMPLMATKKRGPGRPPKSQTLFDSHQILQATQRLNSSASANNFPPSMVPPSAGAFNFNAAFAEMLQQQHQHWNTQYSINFVLSSLSRYVPQTGWYFFLRS